jgi:hypothetical protein
MADLKATQELRKLKQSDPGKFWAKVQRTFWGLGFATLGVVGLAVWEWAWYVGVPLLFAGGIVASGEIVLAPLKDALSLGKSVLGTLRGSNGKSQP